MDRARWRSAWVVIPAIVVLAAAVNLNKPYHIDDTSYLEIAEQIRSRPLHSMSGSLNWHNVSEPIHRTNQPHLFPYLLAAWIHLFGSGEIAVHVLMAMFMAAAALTFFFLARRLAPGSELWLVVLLFGGPAFLPSQNVMVDVPLLFFVLLCFLGISLGADGDDRGWFLAGLASAAAILTKYTALVLLPVQAVTLGFLGRPRHLWMLAIPISALVGWSLLNLWDYGGIHVVARPAEGTVTTRALARAPQLLLCIGSVAPVALLISVRSFTSPWLLRAYALLCVAVGGLVVLMPRNAGAAADFSAPLAALSGVFAANGLWVLGATSMIAARDAAVQRDTNSRILLVWIAAILVFLVAYSPFMAVRHVLLLLPPLLLIVGRSFEFSRHRLRSWSTLTVNSLLAVLLAVSDWSYADVYRREARAIRDQLGPEAAIWFTGHWGWQWYARHQQMRQYETGISDLHPGDFLVQPHLVDKQELDAADRRRLALKRAVIVPTTPWTVIRTMSMAPSGGYYSSNMTSLPWRLSFQPLEQFDVFEVRGK